MSTLPIPVLGKASVAEVRSALDVSGAVLVRGVDFDLQSFEAFSRSFCEEFHIPATRAQRRQKGGDNFSTEVYRDNYSLFGHTEGTYKPYPRWPEICFFMCVTPPAEKGGETTIVDGREFYKRLPEGLRRQFEQSGVMYEMYWEEERWQNEFEMDDIDELEALLKTLPAVRYTRKGDDIHLYFTTNAITKDRRGEKVFATAMLAHLPHITHPAYANLVAYCKPTNKVYFGDGEAIPEDTINQLIDIHDSLVYPHRWQKGDMIVLDNTRFLHGRNMTEKPCERVLVSRFGWLKKQGSI